MTWVEEGFSPTLRSNGRIQDTQILIGHARMTQRRGQATATCEDLGESLMKFYGGPCHPSDGDPQPYGNHVWDRVFRPVGGDSDKDKFVAWLELGRATDTVTERVETLNRFGWLDLETRE